MLITRQLSFYPFSSGHLVDWELWSFLDLRLLILAKLCPQTFLTDMRSNNNRLRSDISSRISETLPFVTSCNWLHLWSLLRWIILCCGMAECITSWVFSSEISNWKPLLLTINNPISRDGTYYFWLVMVYRLDSLM